MGVEHSDALFGWDPTDRIVAVELRGESVAVYRRSTDDTVEVTIEPFRPWLLSVERSELAGADWTELQGDGYRWLARFETWQQCLSARRDLRERNEGPICYVSAQRQYLISSGRTLFKGMSFNDSRRMQIDIETVSLDPRSPANRILLISVTDNRGFEVVIEGTEHAILHALIDAVRERDPDIIEGHNIFRFDLSYLAVRAQQAGIPLALGRDGSDVVFGQKRNFGVGGTTRPFVPVYISGRHIVDTYFAVQHFDWARGEMESYGLKEVCVALGLAAADRVVIDRSRLADIFESDPELVKLYCRQDACETGRLAEIVMPTEFYQAQMAPEGYQNSSVMGTGERINLLMVRAYLHAGRAIPKMVRTGGVFAGGYTEVRRTGVLHRIVKADVESLYPSIMLNCGIAPESDTLGVFLPMLRELTDRRLEAKTALRNSSGLEAEYWDGLQSSFKVLINSFFGYLGAPFHFNDAAAAGRVTQVGRDIARKISAELSKRGAEVIEIDTDGVYFQPPETINSVEAEKQFVSEVREALPEGINLVHDGRYRTMVSLKVKNYALLTYDGKRIFRGASLRSRAEERFGRRFLNDAIDMLMKEDYDSLGRMYLELALKLKAGQVPLTDLIRRERITEKTFFSEQKSRAKLVAEQLALAVGDFVQVYERKDGSLATPEEYAQDENREYYADKLYKFAQRLRDAIGERFDGLFPVPTSKDLNIGTQPMLDLFESDE